MESTNEHDISLKTKLLLSFAGLVACGIGGALLVDPLGFEAAAGLSFQPSPEVVTVDLASELRAPGGALLVGGTLVGAGAFRPRYAELSLWTATLFYLAYGLSRFFGFALDGAPSSTMLGVAVSEVAVGTLCGLALFHRLRQSSMTMTRAS
jgi:hypothetical protein